MDPKHRVYYLVNLNQNSKLRSGWWHPLWDSYGLFYTYNLRELKNSVPSLKMRYQPYDHQSEENYQVMGSCKKEYECQLIRVLRKLNRVNYVKTDPTNKEVLMAQARKCDRCGKFYEKNFETANKSKTTVAGVCFITTQDLSIEDKDLCDDCIVQFKKFMAGCELKEE